MIPPDFLSRNIYVGIPGSELYDYIRNNDLYEYEDEFHILYPFGYLDNVKKYYNDDKYFKTYSIKNGVVSLPIPVGGLINWLCKFGKGRFCRS
jgi:hypothetical protein